MSQLPNIDSPNDGKSPIFPTTHWSAIDSISHDEMEVRSRAMTTLLEKYWRPMEVYIRTKFGHYLKSSKLEVVDLVQEFIQQRMLEGELLRQVDRTKCVRFRNYLQTCLSNFVLEKLRASNTLKQSPAQKTLSLDELDCHQEPNHGSTDAAAVAMDRIWAETLFLRCVEILKKQMEASKRTQAWQLFDLRFLKPFLDGVPPAGYKELATKLGYTNNKAAADAMREIKDQWQRLVRQEISDYIPEKELIEQELKHLITCLSQPNR